MESGIMLAASAATSLGREIDVYFWFLVVFSVAVTLAISAVLLYFGIRFRRRSRLARGVSQHPSAVLEVAWSVIPFFIAMLMFFWSAHLGFKAFKTPPNAMEILVTGKQWMWKLQHPNGRREINALHIPVGQTIKLTITSEDVIHDFFVPAFRVKADAVPGRYTSLWFQPDRIGTYHFFCAQYCGTEHSKMVGWVHVLSPADYTRWLTGEEAGVTPVEAGQKLFTTLGCAACHNGAPGAQGPNMANVFGNPVVLSTGETLIADENYVRESILNSKAKIVKGFQPVMPIFQGVVNETQLSQLLAYIKSLSTVQATGSQTNAPAGAQATTPPAPGGQTNPPTTGTQP